MRPVVSSQGWLVDLSLRSPRQRWWRKSQTTRDKTQPCLRGKSETDCWQRASATTTPFPASHPLTGRKQQPNTTQSTYLGLLWCLFYFNCVRWTDGLRDLPWRWAHTENDSSHVRVSAPPTHSRILFDPSLCGGSPGDLRGAIQSFRAQLPQQSAVHPGLSECVEMKTDQYSVTRSRGAIKKANFLERI